VPNALALAGVTVAGIQSFHEFSHHLGFQVLFGIGIGVAERVWAAHRRKKREQACNHAGHHCAKKRSHPAIGWALSLGFSVMLAISVPNLVDYFMGHHHAPAEQETRSFGPQLKPKSHGHHHPH
jgi:hypothetical protein